MTSFTLKAIAAVFLVQMAMADSEMNLISKDGVIKPKVIRNAKPVPKEKVPKVRKATPEKTFPHHLHIEL